MDFKSYFEKQRDAMEQCLSELVRFKSIETESAGEGAPFGREIAAALNYTLEMGQKMGFATRNVDGYAGHIEYGAGDEIVAVLVHLDVVPEGDGWTYPPFAGETHDGKIFGRGTVDNKGPAVASLFALKALKDMGLPTSKRIRLVLGCDEESGWECMKHYLAAEETPSCGFAPDAEFPIIGSEKGIFAFKLSREFGPPQGGGVWVKAVHSGTRHNVIPELASAELVMLPERRPAVIEAARAYGERNGVKVDVAEKGLDELTLAVHGVAGHASLPHLGVNALAHLVVLLDGLDLTAGASSDYVRFLARHVGLDCHGKAMGVGFEDGVSGKLTLNLGVMELNERGVEAQIDIRCPVTIELDRLREIIGGLAAAANIEMEVLSASRSLYVPNDHFLIRTLSDVYAEETGLKPEVLSIGGGTYARAIPNAVAFGPVFPGQPELAHQRDEFISVEDLLSLARIYAHAMAELAR